VARRADTLTHTPLRLMNRLRLTARFFSSGWRAGNALRSGDMLTRFPWRHLAASGGMMRSAFSECAKTTHSGSLPGCIGRWAGAVSRGPRGCADTASLSLLLRARSREPPSAALKWTRDSGTTPFCGRHFVPEQGLKKGVAEEPEESSVLSRRSRRRRRMLDTTEAASRLTRRGCDAGAAVLGGRGQQERSVEVAKPHRPGGRGVLCAGFGDERWHHR